MIKDFRISFALKNTYRVNSIIYSIKQIPLLKRILPDTLYRLRGLKILAGIVAALWELATAFLGKFLYIAAMVSGIGALFEKAPDSSVFLHILFLLTIIGAYMNTYMFNPTNDKYYAMMLLRMDAKRYTLSNYIYAMLKVVVGFLPFTIGFGLARHVPLWVCILLPLFIAAAKLISAWLFIAHYEKTGNCVNENLLPKLGWSLAAVLLAAAYGLPYLGITIPCAVLLALMGAAMLAGVFAAVKIARFQDYRGMYQLLLADKKNGMDRNEVTKQAVQTQSRKIISQDTGITSRKKGFEYLNELFVKRHRRVLWRPAKRVALIALAVFAGLFLLLRVQTGLAERVNKLTMEFLPYFLFIMYMINRGASFTQALFMNCDHSLLTYSFYKKPRFILRLFGIRLREIIKVNLLPAAVIGAGLSLLLYCSGGTDTPLNYVILPVSILAMSIFFSVHHLTCYYLLQPYNVNTELKGGTYQIVVWITYMVCVAFMQLRLDTFVFGIVVTCFCLVYCAVACVLIYKLAGRTFKLRS